MLQFYDVQEMAMLYCPRYMLGGNNISAVFLKNSKKYNTKPAEL